MEDLATRWFLSKSTKYDSEIETLPNVLLRHYVATYFDINMVRVAERQNKELYYGLLQ